MAFAMSSALAGCSSVERDTKLASSQAAAPVESPGADAAKTAALQAHSGAASSSQPTIELAKTGRLPVALPPAAETATVQTAAMAAPTMAQIVPFKPQIIAAAVQAPAQAYAQPLLPPQPASVAQPIVSARILPATAPKSGRLVSPPVAPAVAAGQVSPAAAQAIALDEKQPTPDMAALQAVVPIPRPDTSVLAYAAQPKAVAAISALDKKMDFPPAPGDPVPATASAAPPELSKLIKRYAGLYGVPESLVHRVVHRESKYDPKAYHKNGYWGLMQIKYATAKSMGYDGKPEGLLDAETNLKYAIKYLRGAWLVADNKNDNAIKLYARGYYYDAKRKDMLDVLEK